MYKLYQGDCLEIMKDIPDKSIDCIICDLPYQVTKCKWDIMIPFDKLWEQYNRIIKDNGAIVLFGTEPFSSYLRMSNMKLYKYDWKWIKQRGTGHLNAKKQPLRNNEDICVFYKKQPTYNPIMLEGKPYTDKRADQKVDKDIYNNFARQTYINKSTRYPLNTLYFDKICNNQLHNTQKPVELLEYLIKTYTNEGDLILDNCIGSGSTIVAALNTNRKAIGIELDENYFNIAKERIDKIYNELNK